MGNYIFPFILGLGGHQMQSTLDLSIVNHDLVIYKPWFLVLVWPQICDCVYFCIKGLQCVTSFCFHLALVWFWELTLPFLYKHLLVLLFDWHHIFNFTQMFLTLWHLNLICFLSSGIINLIKQLLILNNRIKAFCIFFFFFGNYLNSFVKYLLWRN